MNILLVHHFPGVGGGTISALDVIRILRKQGHNVTFAIPKPCQMVVDCCESLGVRIKEIKLPPLYTYHNASSNAVKCVIKYLLSLKNKSYWKELLKDEAPDVVILNSVSQAPLISVVNSLNIRCIITIRETFRNQGSKIANKALIKMISQADVALYLTEYDKKQWNSHNRINVVLPDIVDDNRYTKHSQEEIEDFLNKESLQKKVKYILYLGGISSVKGALNLLLAYERIAEKRKDIGLLLLGNNNRDVKGKLFRIFNKSEYDYYKKCHALIDKFIKYGYPVKDVGIVPDTSYWYESSAVVVFPVTSVHQPRPAYEAGYYSKPIILPQFDNFCEYLIDGVNGLYYERDNFEDLAQKIDYLLGEKVDLENIGMNNHSTFESSHSIRKAEDILINIIKQQALLS